MNTKTPEDLASVIQPQIASWIAELEVLNRDPRVGKFAELRQRMDEADALYRLGPLGHGGIGGRQKRLGIPANELSMFKRDDLEDVVIRTARPGSR